MSSFRPTDSGTLAEIAACWHERLNSQDVTDSTQAEFQTWLNAAPAHRTAYEAISRVWAELRAAAETPAVLALRHEAVLRLTRQNAQRLKPRHAVAAAVAALAVSAGVLIAMAPSSLPRDLTAWMRTWWPQQGHYETARGERLAATLRDGSQVTLDTQSELEVSFSATERRVRLERGQAFFEVVKDRAHPFVVVAGHRRFVAVGTAFDVRLDADRVQVTMVEGTVRVEPVAAEDVKSASAPAGSGPPPAREPRAQVLPGAAARPVGETPEGRAPLLISAGEQLVAEGSSVTRVRAADGERATSWRRGQLIFDAVRLADAIAEVNRYSDRTIELADPALADLRISGAFATGKPDAFVEALTSYFPIHVAISNERAVVLESRP